MHLSRSIPSKPLRSEHVFRVLHGSVPKYFRTVARREFTTLRNSRSPSREAADACELMDAHPLLLMFHQEFIDTIARAFTTCQFVRQRIADVFHKNIFSGLLSPPRGWSMDIGP